MFGYASLDKSSRVERNTGLRLIEVFFLTIVITMGYTTRLRVCSDLGLHTVSVDDVLYEIIQIAYALIVVYQCFLLLEVLYTRLGNSV